MIAAARCLPFYRERIDAALPDCKLRTLDDLRRLPPLERRDLQFRGTELRGPDRLVQRRHTSGSTNRPVEVVWPLEMMRWVDAAERRSLEWLGIDYATRRVYVRTPDAAGVRERIRRRLRSVEFVSPSQLLDPLEKERVLEALMRDPPHTLGGNAGGVYALAEALLERGVELPVEVVLTTGTKLFEYQSMTIQRAFGRQPYDRYGAIETGLVAHPCREARALHVPAEVLLVEIVGDDDEPVTAGEVGHVLVTTLRNRTMPLIRYRLDDLASAAPERCPCGRGLPVLESLVGRASEVVRLADGTPVPADAVTNRLHAAAAGSILEFEVVQEKDGSVSVTVVQRATPTAARERDLIASSLDDLLGVPGTTTVERVRELPLPANGKRRNVVSKVPWPRVSV